LDRESLYVNQRPVKRRYDSSRRQAQARQLRLEVTQVARTLFVEQGYAATTMADVARGAGVSQQFLYASFGSKRGLLAKVIGWTLAGDAEPIPMAQRPSILAVRNESTLAGKCARQSRHVRLVTPRAAAMFLMMRAAGDADPDAREIYATSESQRRQGAKIFVADLLTVGTLRAQVTPEHAADAIWGLNPAILWMTLVAERGWTPDEFEYWYAGQLGAAVLDDARLPAVREFSRKLIAHESLPDSTAATPAPPLGSAVRRRR
jgi:TetR/AcrR family transcriptional regulator, regulator of autoinduction and epiphytic fitness